LSYSSEVLADNPISYWRLGEPSGTNAADEKGVNAGTHGGSALVNQTGLLVGDSNKAVDYNGTTAFTKVADNASLNVTAAVTLEAIVRADTFPAGYNFILGKYVGGSNAGYELYGKSDNNIGFFIRGGGASTEFNNTSGSLTVGGTFHLVATFDDAANTVRLFINGAKVFENTGTAVTLSTNTGLLSFGARSVDGIADPSALFWDGILDELAVYGSALSEARVTAHYNASITTSSSVILPSWPRVRYTG
jgi:hypothetical protein